MRLVTFHAAAPLPATLSDDSPVLQTEVQQKADGLGYSAITIYHDATQSGNFTTKELI